MIPVRVYPAAAFTGSFWDADGTKMCYGNMVGLVSVAAAMPAELVFAGDDVAVRINPFSDQAPGASTVAAAGTTIAAAVIMRAVRAAAIVMSAAVRTATVVMGGIGAAALGGVGGIGAATRASAVVMRAVRAAAVVVMAAAS